MKIKFKTKYLIGIFVGLFLIVFDLFIFLGTRWFLPALIISFLIMTMQFWLDIFKENKRQKDIEENFLEFVRSLVETVRSGISIPSAILNVSDKDFGELTPYVEKLANQIRLGIPIHEALLIFSKDTGNNVIKRSISVVIEAEESGGDIEDVLESVTQSVVQVKRVKEERKTSTFSQIVQGYIIFFVFIAIMLVLQLKLFPTLLEFGSSVGSSGVGFGISLGAGDDFNFDIVFVAMILIQGFFVGLMIGKFSEGEIKYGIKHSLALMVIALLVVTTVKGSLF